MVVVLLAEVPWPDAFEVGLDGLEPDGVFIEPDDDTSDPLPEMVPEPEPDAAPTDPAAEVPCDAEAAFAWTEHAEQPATPAAGCCERFQVSAPIKIDTAKFIADFDAAIKGAVLTSKPDERDTPHARALREAEIAYCNAGLRVEEIRGELKGAKQDQKNALEHLMEVRNSNPANYTDGLENSSGDDADDDGADTDPAAGGGPCDEMDADEDEMPLGVPMGSLSPADISGDATAQPPGSPPLDWRTAPTSSLKFETIKGIGVKKAAEICAKYPTIGALEDLRASGDGFKCGLRQIEGVGEKKADAMEDRLLEWLTKNRDAELFQAAAKPTGFLPQLIAECLTAEVPETQPQDWDTANDPDEGDFAELADRMNRVCEAAVNTETKMPNASMAAKAVAFTAEVERLEQAAAADAPPDYSDRTHPEHGSYQSGREAYGRGDKLKDNPSVGENKKAWAAGWKAAHEADNA